MSNIKLIPLTSSDREQFIKDNQEAFRYGATEEFGLRDAHFEEDGEIIARQTIADAIDAGSAFRIVSDGCVCGGIVLRINGTHGDLDLLFVAPALHGKGIGQKAWSAVEKMFPKVTRWETMTPYFEKRNIHFYVNRCGFHIVEFFCSHHPETHSGTVDDSPGGGEMFRFEKCL